MVGVSTDGHIENASELQWLNEKSKMATCLDVAIFYLAREWRFAPRWLGEPDT
jgi:hypothetical protein